MAHSQTDDKPIVTLAAAMTLDGKIATKTGDSKISTTKDLKMLHLLRSRNDAVMIGIGTLLKDNPLLTVRYVQGKSPIRIIVDRTARTPLNSRILTLGGPPVIVAVTRGAPKKRVNALRKAGAKVFCVGKTHVSLKTLLTRLHRLGIERLLLEGGGELNWSMISNRLVDNIRVTVAPIITGGSHAPTLVDGEGIANIRNAISLIPISVRRDGKEIILNYKVN